MARFEWNKIKKNKEQNQLEIFCESLSEIKGCEIQTLDKEFPDGLLILNGKKVSVELTELLWDTDKRGINKKEQESLGDQIVRLAEKKYEKLNLPPLYVSISFTDQYGLNHTKIVRLNPKDKEILSDYLVQKVSSNIPLENSSIELEEYNEIGERIFNDKVSSIWVGRYKELDENCWTIGGGGVIPNLTFEKIKERIDAKNKRLPMYKNSYDESWLVMIEYWNDISGYFSFRFADDILKNNFNSQFDRTFILRSRKREIIELDKAE